MDDYIMRKKVEGRLPKPLRVVGNISLGVAGGIGFVRLYFQHWPTEPAPSIQWLLVEAMPFLVVTLVIMEVIYVLLIALGFVKRPT